MGKAGAVTFAPIVEGSETREASDQEPVEVRAARWVRATRTESERGADNVCLFVLVFVPLLVAAAYHFDSAGAS